MKVLGIEPCSIGRLESDDSAVFFFTMSLAKNSRRSRTRNDARRRRFLERTWGIA